MRFSRIAALAILFLGTLASSSARAQGTRADYDRAYALNPRFEGLVADAPETPVFIGRSDRFWYRKSVSPRSWSTVSGAGSACRWPCCTPASATANGLRPGSRRAAAPRPS